MSIAPLRRARSWVVVTGLVLFGLAGVGGAVIAFDPWAHECDTAPSVNQVRWPPPAGWEDFATVEIDPRGGRVRLDDDVDYRLVAPELVTGPVEVVGGRDVVWLGGHIRIDERGMVSAGERRGLLIRDDGDESVGRTVHIEGLLIDGDEVSEGVDIDAPSAVLQLTNLRVEDIGFRNADDRDGTGPYEGVGDNHPDVLQTYGGFRELRVDGLTATSAYQGLFFKVDSDEGRGRPIKLRRVDVRAVSRDGTDGVEYAGNRMFFWDVDTVGDVHLESGTVWVQHHPDAGKVDEAPNPREGSGSWWHGAFRDGDELVLEEPPGTAGVADAVERRHSRSDRTSTRPTRGEDELGTYLTWPDGEAGRMDAELLALDDDDRGRIYGGTPPAGSFVPRSAVGLDHRSSGYEAC